MLLTEIADDEDKLQSLKKSSTWLTAADLKEARALVKKLSLGDPSVDEDDLNEVLWARRWKDPIVGGFSVLMYTVWALSNDGPEPGELKITTFTKHSEKSGKPMYIENYSFAKLVNYFDRVQITQSFEEAYDDVGAEPTTKPTLDVKPKPTAKFSANQKRLQKWLLAKYEGYYRDRNKEAPALDLNDFTIHSESTATLKKWLKKVGGNESIVMIFIMGGYTGKQLDVFDQNIMDIRL